MTSEGKDFRPPETPRRNEREVTAGLTVSGMLIAVSFIAMVIPLAIYHVAQVAAALRLRTAILLLLTVVGIVLFLGLTFRSELLMLGGIVGAFWSPLIALALFERKKRHPWWISALLFLLPLVGFAWLAFSIPQIPDFDAFFETRKTEFIASLQESTSLNNPEARKEIVSSWTTAFERFREQPEFNQIAQLAAFNNWQRLMWSVFGGGAALFLGLVVIAFGNLFFLDFAFEQVEKFRAVVSYVLTNRAQFGRQLIESLENLRSVRRAFLSSGISSLQVLSHERKSESEDSSLWRKFLIPKLGRQTGLFWGYEFHFAKAPGNWGLRLFALPLWMALASVAVLVALTLSYGSVEGLIGAAQSEWGWLLSLLSVVAFFLVCVVAVQGMLTIYIRVMPFALLILLLAFLMVGAYGILNAHFIVAVFAAVGLLDYVYDFRGRLVKPLHN